MRRVRGGPGEAAPPPGGARRTFPPGSACNRERNKKNPTTPATFAVVTSHATRGFGADNRFCGVRSGADAGFGTARRGAGDGSRPCRKLRVERALASEAGRGSIAGNVIFGGAERVEKA